MKSVSCLHPVKILHPSYLDLFMKYDTLVCVSHSNELSYTLPIFSYARKNLYEDGFPLFKVFPILQNHKYFDVVELCDSETGESESLFIEVPCGHCAACESRRYNGIVQRLTLECEEHESLPLFVTLTYNDNHLPSDGVSMRDIQLFKKRFSKLVFSLYGVRIKYAVFSEYGKLGRPHYHCIIYGYPYKKNDYTTWITILSQINFCWRSFPKSGYSKDERFSLDSYCKQHFKLFNIKSIDKVDPFSMGFVNVSFTDNANVIGYVTKYISKGSNVPSGKNLNFRSLSIRLGLDFVKNKRNFILNSSDSTLVYKPRFSSKLQKIHLTKYYINYLFPSFSKLVPVEFRRKWLSLLSTSLWIVRNKYLPLDYRHFVFDRLQAVSMRFPSLCKIVELDVDEKSMFSYSVLHKRFRYNQVYESLDYILSDLQSWYSFFDSFDDGFEEFVQKCVIERDEFLSKFGDTADPLISAIAYQKNLSINLSKIKL